MFSAYNFSNGSCSKLEAHLLAHSNNAYYVDPLAFRSAFQVLAPKAEADVEAKQKKKQEHDQQPIRLNTRDHLSYFTKTSSRTFFTSICCTLFSSSKEA